VPSVPIGAITVPHGAHMAQYGASHCAVRGPYGAIRGGERAGLAHNDLEIFKCSGNMDLI